MLRQIQTNLSKRIRKRNATKTIYCGNNRKRLTRKNRLGTRYTCLRKGFGIGYHLPVDKELIKGYEPIDDIHVYCGNKTILPNTYDRFGNLPDCLQKGVSVGQIKKAQEVYRRTTRRRII
jgi:hypothetical protein